jgi:PIN domain nuclease of toxin-antitoxin system
MNNYRSVILDASALIALIAQEAGALFGRLHGVEFWV